MTREEFMKIMQYLMAAIPRWDVHEGTIEVFYQELGYLDAAALWRGAREYVRTKTFPPSIAELLELSTHDPKLEPAEQAWMRIVDLYSPYGTSWDEDENRIAARAAKSVFSDGVFGETAFLPDFDDWHRKAFIEAYNAFARRDQRERALGPVLEGRPERGLRSPDSEPKRLSIAGGFRENP